MLKLKILALVVYFTGGMLYYLLGVYILDLPSWVVGVGMSLLYASANIRWLGTQNETS